MIPIEEVKRLRESTIFDYDTKIANDQRFAQACCNWQKAKDIETCENYGKSLHGAYREDSEAYECADEIRISQ